MNSTVDRQKELNEKIAELCGWKRHGSFINCFKQEVPTWLLGGPDEGGRMAYGVKDLPDYCNDLNACAEFEKLLDTEERQRCYVEALVQIPWYNAWAFTDVAKAVCATALQRAEAFAKTMEATSVQKP